MGTIWEQKHFKVKGFLNFSYEAPMHKVPKTWEKWISLRRESINTSSLWVWVKQKSIQFPKHGKSEFSYYGKSMGKTDIPKLCVYQLFWVKQKYIQFQKHGESGFP